MRTIAAVAVALLSMSCPPEPKVPETVFTWAVDAQVPHREALPDEGHGARPLAASRDSNGVISDFVENEVVLTDVTEQQLEAFLRETGGAVIETDQVPAPPPGIVSQLTPEERAATQFTVRVDPDAVSLASFKADAVRTGLSGDRAFSSERAAKLMALVARQRSAGLMAELNYALTPSGAVLRQTEEHPRTGGGFWDAFTFFALTAHHPERNVLGAWQFVAAHGFARRINVAIIDGGFWLDGAGMPGSILGGRSDLPTASRPVQYDFDGDDSLAGGPNGATCSGGKACPWHGNSSAGAAVGIPDNRYGGAGSGGFVGEPFLFRTNLTRSQIRRAVRTAIDWGADVVSMSFGGSCNLDCTLWPGTAGAWMATGQQKGLIFVASAGNDDKNVDAEFIFPCLVPGVLCIGAMDAQTVASKDYSNYGASVDLWASSDVAVMPNPAISDLTTFGGTSASAPLVAGVVAMMKAVNPGLKTPEVTSMLLQTAFVVTSDPKLGRALDAREAVKLAAKSTLPPDAAEPNDSAAQATSITPGQPKTGLTLFPDKDYFRFALTDYATVQLSVERARLLGNVSVSFTQASNGAAPVDPTLTTWTGGTLKTAMLGPGDFTFAVKGDDLSVYDLRVDTSPVFLAPDVYEPNETLPTARLMKRGTHFANRHVPTDLDFYAFPVPSLPLLQVFTFRVLLADQPVWLRLSKDGAQVATTTPSKSASFTIDEPGNYVIEVSSTGRNRYAFHAGTELNPSVFGELPVPAAQIPIIDPTDETTRWMVGPRDVFGFTQSARNLTAYGSLALEGAGLHLKLFSSAGVVLAQGTPVALPDGAFGERLALEATTAGQTYLLTVERQGVGAAGDEELLPMIHYSLGWQAR